jgi:cysteine desulfurase
MIVGLGEALEIAGREAAKESPRLTKMCREFMERILACVDGAVANGHPTDRIPGNASLSISGIEPLALMHRMNHVASFSASSACATDKVETSHVLRAMFGDTQRARQAFRVSPGRHTIESDLLTFTSELINVISELRRFAA